MGQAFPAPTFSHAADAFLIAHTAPGAWSAGTAVKYKQTLTALGGQLDGAGQAAASDVAVLGTPAGASALETAFTAAFGRLAPATRARHLSALRSALAWWAEAGWVTADPTAGWARPKVPVDTTRALTRAQVAAIWKLDVPLRDKAMWRMLYETAARAEEILGLDVPDLDLPSEVHGWTLHQLRHSLLTHEAEDGTSTPMLLARSRHASVRSLERYARPGPEAVARHVAAADPAARRRRP